MDPQQEFVNKNTYALYYSEEMYAERATLGSKGYINRGSRKERDPRE